MADWAVFLKMPQEIRIVTWNILEEKTIISIFCKVMLGSPVYFFYWNNTAFLNVEHNSCQSPWHIIIRHTYFLKKELT